MPDNQIGYEYAGKGHRSRLRLEDVTAKKLGVKRRRPYTAQKPEHENRRAKEKQENEHQYGVSSLKTRVRLAVINEDIGFIDLMSMLKRERVPLSGVTAGNLRNDMREILRLLESEGLLNVEALTKRRKRRS